MKNPVRFGGTEVPLWVLQVLLVGLCMIGAAVIAVAATWRMSATRQASGASALATPATAVERAVAPTAERTSAETAGLAAKPPESLTAKEVLLLSSVASEKERQAAKLFREKLERDPSVVKDKAVLAELRKLTLDPNTAPEALAAVAELPGPVSADLLYDIWTGTPNRTDATELARALLYSRDVRPKASEPLSVALDLRVAEACEPNRSLLPRALSVGDRRSLPLLTKLKRNQGCGPNKKQDCYACLRAGGDLDAAITAVKARRP